MRHTWFKKTLCGATALVTAASLVSLTPILTPAASAASSTGGYSANTTSYCKSGATPITFWGWVPGMYRVVDVFNQTHPSICVDYVTKVGGSGEYIPLLNALKANSGAPDVAEIEFDVLPEFETLHYTVDLAPYGAAMYKNDFVNWAWGEVTQGSHIWAMPDGWWFYGPALQRHPARQVRDHLPPDELGTVRRGRRSCAQGQPEGVLRRLCCGRRPMGPCPHAAVRRVAVRLERRCQRHDQLHWAKQMAFANWWQTLISQGSIDHANDPFTSASPFFEGLNSGLYLTWPTSAWGPSYFASYVTSKSAGQWVQGALPGSATSSGNWGGSTYPVFTESKHPAQAATFVEWLCGSAQAWKIEVTPPSLLFPNFKPELSAPGLLSLTIPMLKSGGSLFAAPAKSAPGIPAVTWPPFMTYYLNSTTAWASKFFAGKMTLPQYFQLLQTNMVSYAKSEGFTVST